MANRIITTVQLASFRSHLHKEERSAATVEKYLSEVTQFFTWLSEKEVTKTRVSQWKEHLLYSGYEPSTVNGKLTALDRLLDFLGWGDCKVKHLKLQRRLFRDDSRELTKAEYERLICAAGDMGNERLSLLMESICGTGIRVSELKFFTVEAVRKGEITVSCKGKNRTILLPGLLCRRLLAYAEKEGIASGMIFVTRRGNPVNRSNIWAQMKGLCREAGVKESKIFPHNLRKLFARTFYGIEKDIARLADILGHSSINTTRIYIVSTGTEHRKKIECLGLVV